jgi:cytochrome c oxidase cbb3-type subunit III
MFAVLILVASAMAFGAEADKDEPDKKVKLPTGKRDRAAGEALFQNHCALCHGTTGGGGRGPALAQARLKRATDDASLVKLIEEGIPGTEMPGAWQLDRRELLQVSAYVRSLSKVEAKPVPGDAEQGRKIYESKGGCSSCHTVKGHGRAMGPELSAIGLRRSTAYLRDAILKPEADVPESFLQVRVTPLNGPAVTGMRLSEDAFSLEVRDYSGRLHAFWKKDIKEIAKDRGKSPMPSYADKLTESEITDLIAYLSSLREDQ